MYKEISLKTLKNIYTYWADIWAQEHENIQIYYFYGQSFFLVHFYPINFIKHDKINVFFQYTQKPDCINNIYGSLTALH